MKGIRLPSNIRVDELLFFFSYGLFLLFSVLRTSLYYQYFIGSIYTLILLICVGTSFVIEILCNVTFNKKSLIGITVLFGLYLIITYANRSLFTGVGVIPLLIMSSRRIDFMKIARFSLILMSAAVIFIVVSADMHIIRNIVIISSSGRRREFLGFRFPLNAPAMLFNITSLYIYIKKDSFKLISAVVLLLLNIYLFLRTDSKLSFVLSVMMIVFCWAVKFFYDRMCRSKILTTLMVYSFVLSFVFSIAMALAYDNDIKWMRTANELVEDRLYFASYSLEKYGVSLFGEKIPWVGWGTNEEGKSIAVNSENYFYVDNMYIQIMQRYGVILMGLFIAANTLALRKAKRSKDLYCLIILTVIALRSIIDNLSFQLYYNTFLFMISYKLFYKGNMSISMDNLRRYLKKLGLLRRNA